MLRNVTELEQTKLELERKNKELSQFAHIASHDLKEPLYTISTLIELIKNEHQEALDEKAIKLLNFIAQSTERMRNVINILLDHSSIGQGKEFTRVDCQQLAEIIQQDLKAKILESNATIGVGLLPTINGLETEMRLLFQNLISNAIKYRRPGIAPKIKITAKEQDGYIFCIQDNGIGIAAEHQKKIFNIFSRLHHKDDYEGTGIGLAHCKKIVELHKGKIWVESTLGEGSTFYFTIPNP
jgi:light-regulated signal transduction histidine kinase (bacteriophytochrome)